MKSTKGKNLANTRAGNAATEAAYGTELNSGTQKTPWHRPATGEMFTMPRSLKVGDSINVSGTARNNPDKLILSLLTDSDTQNADSNVFLLEASIAEGKVSFRVRDQDISEPDDVSAGNILSDGFFDFRLSFIETFNVKFLHVYGYGSTIKEVELTHDIEEIRYLYIDGDIQKVAKLEFNFG